MLSLCHPYNVKVFINIFLLFWNLDIWHICSCILLICVLITMLIYFPTAADIECFCYVICTLYKSCDNFKFIEVCLHFGSCVRRNTWLHMLIFIITYPHFADFCYPWSSYWIPPWCCSIFLPFTFTWSIRYDHV